MMAKCLVVGDLIEDVIVVPEGSVVSDTDNQAKIAATLGGSATNFAVWASTLGMETHLVARVGRGDGSKFTKLLADKSVIAHLQEDKQLSTGRIVVLSDGENRTFFTDRGANVNLEPHVLPVEALGDYLYLSGYSVLSMGTQGAQKLIEIAQTNGMAVIVDPGSESFIRDYGAKYFLEAIAGADVLLPNLAEAKILSGEDSLVAAADKLNRLFKLVVVTLGAEGALVKNATTVEQVSAPDAKVVDTTGAGDAFAAMFIRHLAEGATPLHAAQEACIFASRAVEMIGGQPI